MNWWSDDDRLLAAIGDAFRSADDMPDRFAEMGKAVYTWFGIDAELATLTYDSVADDDAAVLATRAAPATLRYLTFTSADITIELEVTEAGLVGQIVPPQPGRLEVRTSDGAVSHAVIDEVGGFSLRPVPRGTFRLHCRTRGSASAVTDPITLTDRRDG